MRRICILLLFIILPIFAYRYAIVVSNTTYSMNDWRAICDSLRLKHQGRIFIYTSSIYDVLSQLQNYQPDYISFVGRPVSEVNRQFVRNCHQLTRQLDDDIYGDAIWGIITGYTAEDALRIIRYDSLWVRTVLGGTNCTWDYWIEKGISTYEAEYNRIRFKFPNGTTLDTIWPERCPTDRCTLLVNYLNNGIDDTVPNRPRIVGNIDIFVTSGHASQWEWQLHYPGSGYEGFFRSSNGQLRGDPYSGASRYINSSNPKLYFAVGNCLIGDVVDMNCMVLAWFHTGGAIQMTGYIVETWYGYMLWGLPAYYHYLQGRTTYAQAFYLNNQSLLFDQINNTPGTNPSGLEYDKNNVAFYGDPACQTRIYPIREPYYSENIEIRQGTLRDTFIITITANYDSSTLGFSGVSGTRHPIVFLPVKIESIQVENTNAHSVVITDNFCLFYVWYQGQRKFVRGETRYVRFTAKRKQVAIKEITLPIIKKGIQKEKIKGEIYDIFGRKINRLRKGIYFIKENEENFKIIKM
ncbi:MAG: hypothetical protein RMJ34_05390 [candidate division WOR-3 bacterium]|nr:hypothetical protein [candidate division WOR-3 bacterium]MDW8114351.1 hypothetical protein [candidate division WOR-3 bacterium]